MHCLHCRQHLEYCGATECPRCGRPFDPDVPSTYSDADRSGVSYWSPGRQQAFIGTGFLVAALIGLAVLLWIGVFVILLNG